MPDNRPSMQVNQPDIINVPETNWPDPLVDPSSKLKMKVTHGSNGEQIAKTLMATDGQDQLSLTEGKAYVGIGDQGEQGGHSDKFKTSQMNPPNHSTPGDE